MAASVRCVKCQRFKSTTAPCKACGELPEQKPLDEEVLFSNVVLAKRNQFLSDILTRERRTFREFARAENRVGEYLTYLTELLEQGNFTEHPPVQRTDVDEEAVLLVQLSDLHFIETISQPENKFNFKVASQRLAKLASRIKNVVIGYKVSKVVVACLGDIINSDRRQEEAYTNQETRAKGTLIAADILQGFINDISTHAPVEVYGITGNEGRIDKDVTWDDRTATNNFDFMVYHILRVGFRNHSRISFKGFRSHELLLEILDRTILCIHGHQVGTNTQKAVQEIIGKHASNGVIVNFVLMGHIHATYLGDYHSRNSSLSGGNGYSGNGLNFASKAAQMLHLITPGSLDSIKVDLQDISNVEPYKVDQEWAEHFIEEPLINLKTKSIVIQIPVTG
jgi:predicted phosphodiesterase